MRVSGFMVPTDKVVCCDPKNTIRKVMDTMLEKKIGAVVVLKENVPLGIITKTDIMKAYKDNLTLDHSAEEIMTTNLETCDETMSRDQAARVLERNKVCTKLKGGLLVYFYIMIIETSSNLLLLFV
jgi:CBS domain-containing protein